MQIIDIQALADKAKNRLLTGQQESLTTGSIASDKPIDKVKISKFWQRMSGLFGFKWSSQYGETQSGEWLTLVNHLSEHAIEIGVKNMVATSDGWPPTPIEFNHLCSNVSLKALGLPDLDTAFNRALSGMYRNNIIEAAAKETGVFDLQRGVTSDLQLKKHFEYNYFEMARRWANGESLSKPVTKAIEHTQENASISVCDDLIEQGIREHKVSGKTGYEAFLEAKKNLRGRV